MTINPKYLDKNKKALMLFSVLAAFSLSYYLYITRLDVDIHRSVIAWGSDAGFKTQLQDVWGLLSRIGEDWFKIIVSITMGVFYYKKCHYQLSRVWYSSIIIYMLSGVLVQIMKFIVGRPRPKMLPEYNVEWFEFGARMNSWPSGHTITTFAFLACVLPFYPRKIQIPMVLLAGLIGFSRVGIGAHYMGDVISGAVLGYVVGTLLLQKFKLRKSCK
tara:strand:- start:115244 stop:115891 length:648 start_codon:yes stop_codon:yes gene_type:complete